MLIVAGIVPILFGVILFLHPGAGAIMLVWRIGGLYFYDLVANGITDQAGD